jgi:WD40 repeat protein
LDPLFAPFKPDIEALEHLFTSEEQRVQRKLAELHNHIQPVNCVRWNPIGTVFASGGDDGRTILWEYKGLNYVSRSQEIFNNAEWNDGGVSQEDFKNQGDLQEDKVEVREEWQTK